MKIKCNTAPASSSARNKAPKTHSQPSFYHKLQAFIHVCFVMISPLLLFCFSLTKKINGVALSLAAVFTETLLLPNLTMQASHGCSYLKPVVETCKVGIPGQLLPNRNKRRVTPAEHWGCRAGRPRARERSPLQYQIWQ